MLIVDAQVHIWGSGPPTNPAHRQVSVFTKDDLLQEMDAAGVNAAVIHPPGWDPHANEVAVEAARQQTWPTDGTMDWLWPVAERAGLPVTLLAANFMPVVGHHWRMFTLY